MGIIKSTLRTILCYAGRVTNVAVLEAPQIPNPNVITITGLSSSGRSTIYEKMKDFSDPPAAIPKLRAPLFNYVELKFKTRAFKILDVDTLSLIRAGMLCDTWTHYAADSDVFVFVVDRTRRSEEQTSEIKRLFALLANMEKFRNIPFIIFANKSDVEDIIGLDQIEQLLDLAVLPRKWCLIETSAMTGVGIVEGIEWILENTSPKCSNLNSN